MLLPLSCFLFLSLLFLSFSLLLQFSFLLRAILCFLFFTHYYLYLFIYSKLYHIKYLLLIFTNFFLPSSFLSSPPPPSSCPPSLTASYSIFLPFPLLQSNPYSFRTMVAQSLMNRTKVNKMPKCPSTKQYLPLVRVLVSCEQFSISYY